MSIADALFDAACEIRDYLTSEGLEEFHPIRYRTERLLGEMDALRIALDHDYVNGGVDLDPWIDQVLTKMDALRIELDRSLTEEEWAARMPPEGATREVFKPGRAPIFLNLTPEQAIEHIRKMRPGQHMSVTAPRTLTDAPARRAAAKRA